MTPGRTIGPVNPVGSLSSVRKGVKIKSTICACAGCGLVWGHLVPDQLIEHLEMVTCQAVRGIVPWRARHLSPPATARPHPLALFMARRRRSAYNHATANSQP